jgi:serine/threonine protein kinase
MLIEPLGLFGWNDNLRKLGIWGLISIIAPSIIIGIMSIFFPFRPKRKDIKILIEKSIDDIKIPIRLDEKYEKINILQQNPMSLILNVRRRSDGKQFLIKQIQQDLANLNVYNKIQKIFENNPFKDHVALPIEILKNDGNYFEVIKYINGWTIDNIMRLNPQGAKGSFLREWATELTQLVALLHNNGIIHRDINPFNILICSDTLSMVLLDFTTCILNGAQSNAVQIYCPNFSAPEVRENKYSYRSDVYSIGALLAYIESGQLPPTYEERVYKNKYINLNDRENNLVVANAIYNMLEENSEDRYENAQEAFERIKSHATTKMIIPNILGVFNLPDGSYIEMQKSHWNWVHKSKIT